MTFTISRRTFLAAAALAPVTTRLAMAADAPLRIGYSMCLTGLFAQAAPSQVNAYELWKDQVNSSATSVPPPMAMPTSAAASVGRSSSSAMTTSLTRPMPCASTRS